MDADAERLLECIAADLHPVCGGGALGPSAYDTASVAMVRDPKNTHELAFPRSFEGLFDLQCADGSFGTPYPYTIVPTLAALLCLKKAPNQDTRTQDAAERARIYLEKVFPNWDVAHHETVAFEFLVPFLLSELDVLGTKFDFPHKAQLLAYAEKKMTFIRPEWLYEKRSTLAFSLDAFPGRLDFSRLQGQRGPDGSYGGSPASTAAMLTHGSWDEPAVRWIEYLYARGCCEQPGLMPGQFGLDCFEVSWAVHYLAMGGFSMADRLPRALVQTLVQWLERCITPSGAGWYVHAPHWMADADDTALAMAALMHFGTMPTLDPLLRFEAPDRFLCFEGERNPSTSPNAHVLHTLLELPEPMRRAMQSRIDKTTNFLLGHGHSEGYWTDKWHASPTYATSCAVIALAKSNHPAAQKALEKSLLWTLEMQNAENGGWGMLGASTAEETVYALMILFAMENHVPANLEKHVQWALKRGMTYLRQHAEPPTGRLAYRPSLWIAKDLYTPIRVVEAAILAMLRRGIDIPSTTMNTEA